ncbi:hypothetical protein AAFO92_17705 [Roseovarius sp. CAU 1744]|uniref:hypothetical protein n=1 Tax=Roseovarius sp. CAU 1744 TaxID=3140368 RepID=UPI00325C1976
MSGSATPQHLPKTARDLPGLSGADADARKAAELNADILIREVMIEQKRQNNHQALPEIVADGPETTPAPIKHPRRLFRRKRTGAPDDTLPKTAGQLSRAIGAGILLVRGYRPSRKHLIFAVLAAIMYFRPWLLPGTLFITFLCVLIGYLTLGPDRVAELVVGAWQRLHARRPDLAETIRQRAEAMAVRIDAALDRMPGKWADGVHVPDFSKPDPAEADRPDPFERLAKEAQGG